jgi:uncharacterized repeat protein (TIGR03806 family)
VSGLARVRLFCLAVVVTLCGCSRGVRPYLEEPYPAKLSAWRLFAGDGAKWRPAPGVIPYDINTPLFSDYAEKARTVWMPKDTAAEYRADGAFAFPVGTVFSKTFSFNARRIETRLLIHTARGWVGLPYVWNDAQSEAVLEVTGDEHPVKWTHPNGKQLDIDYHVPNVNQCKECHERDKAMTPIGPRARQLNRDFAYPEGRANQLEYWTRVGYLKGAPPKDQAPRMAVWNDPSTGSVEARARAYLDANCAHCHQTGSAGNTAGLYLGLDVTDPLRLGVCKTPVSAGIGSGGLRFAVVAGRPDLSFLVYRMDSTQPKVMMPELGRTVVHEEGVALIRQWIATLTGGCS